MTCQMPGRATAAASGRMTRRDLLVGTSRLGLLSALVSLGALAACKEAPDEPWADGSYWSDGTGWRP
jgi:hypothetical protein